MINRQLGDIAVAESGIFVREAKPADAPAIVRFQLEMARETEGLELDLPTVQRGVAAVFADPRIGSYWVAEATASGDIAASLLTLPEWSDWRCGTVLWIHSVYVRPEFRRRGVYREMYGHLERMVRQSEHYKGLRLYVDKRNTAAQQVYESLGMDGSHYALYEWMKS